MGSQLKEALRTLCCSNGWSYGVLWRVKSSDSTLLIFEDAYYEEQIATQVEKMVHQVQLVGQGIIGQVAVTGQHRWILLDASCQEPNPVFPFVNQAMFQTTAVISVPPQFVVQFGSTQKIPEKLEFVDQAKSLLQQGQSLQEDFPYEKSEKAFGSETYDPCGTFISVLPSNIPSSNFASMKFLDDSSRKELIAKAQCLPYLTQPSNPSTMGSHLGSLPPHGLAVPVIPGSTYANKDSDEILQKTTVFMTNSSFPLVNCQKAGTDCQVTLSTSFMKMQHVLLKSDSSSTSSSAISCPSVGTWSGDISSLTSMEEGLTCGTRIQRSQGTFPTNLDTHYPCGNMFPYFQGNQILNPLHNSNRALDATPSKEYEAGKQKLADGQHTSPPYHVAEGSPCLLQLPKEPSSVGTCLPDFGSTNTTFVDSNPSTINNMSHWTGTPLKQVDEGLTTPLNVDLLQTFDIASTMSDVVRDDAFSGIPVGDLPHAFQNSVDCKTDIFWTVSNGKENSLNVPVQLPEDKDLFDSLQLLEHGQHQGLESWDNIILPSGTENSSNLTSCSSFHASEFDAGSMNGPEKGFFPEGGLEQLLNVVANNGNLVASHNSDDRLLTTTATRMGNSNQVPLGSVSGISRSMNSMLSESSSQKILHGPQKEMLSTTLVSSWIGGSHNTKGENVVVSQPRRSDEPAKYTKKRAKPGESTRPRPKDRQQIQDRVKELREIVPNGTKCSIDALLDRTIKHMLFLESVAKYADKIKQIDEPKIIGKESSVVLKDSGNAGGTTWAFQLGGQTMVCPILVEDLNPPGQMLVEILCQECGSFLEIADIIRGFGLTILKGVMEVLEDKIWARFVVEAKQNVTRMDIFLSLVKLLQQTASGIRSGNQSNKVTDGDVPVFPNYQQPPMPLPIS